MRFDVLSIFPEMFEALSSYGMVKRALEKGCIEISLVNIRDFGEGPHLMVDDRPFGGGSGMVMKPEPIFRALSSIPGLGEEKKVILLTPQGQLFNQSIARRLSRLKQIILICGRYEGVDERIKTEYVDMEISIGDFILTGGELPAMIVVDAVCRLLPGVLGGENSALNESFEDGLLEYPQYTRPRVFQGREVPRVLLSGNHKEINSWRRTQSLKKTMDRRPKLLEKAKLSQADKIVLEKLKKEGNQTVSRSCDSLFRAGSNERNYEA